MSEHPRIPVCSARFDGNEKRYLAECIDTGWVSSSGPFVKRFEAAFAEYVGTREAVTASSGTAALHMALLALGIGPGDEVAVPALTMIASGNAVLYTGAAPVIVDVEPATGNLDLADLARKVTPRTRAVMAVHLYGLPCATDALTAFCRERRLALVEDAAEAIGTTCEDGRAAGGVGELGCFSFFANKVITAGEGGIVTTDDAELAHLLRRVKDQWFVPEQRFFHPEVGYNYRLSNLQAAVALAQLERVEALVEARLTVARRYHELLADQPALELPPDGWRGGRNSHWMYAVRVAADAPGDRDGLAAFLRARNIDTRGFFVPLNEQPAFAAFASPCPTAQDWSRRGLLLPTGPTLTGDEQDRVAQACRDYFETGTAR